MSALRPLPSTPSPSPTITAASQLDRSILSLPVPPTSATASTSSLHRQNSRSSHRSGLVPSPNDSHGILSSNSATPSASSSASGSKPGSLISTPRLLSRRSSTKDSHRPSTMLMRKESSKGKGKGREDEEALGSSGPSRAVESHEGWKSPRSESGSEVIETPQLRLERDPGTGRKMINQYLVLREIGHGTHGTVRLGRDMSIELPAGEEGDVGLGIAGHAFYAIKIVERNPKKKRLTGFSRQRAGLSRTDGVKMINESEIRKEIAIFKKVNHPNVVRMKEIIDDPDSSKLFMILEYCENGEIHWKDEDGLPALTVSEIRRIFRNTLLGLEYLHHQGIIHRDIKPSNLLLAGDGSVKISDFGCSHYSEALRAASAQSGPDGEEYIDDVELAKTAGSPAFFAPEMCYSGLDNEIGPRRSLSPANSPGLDMPAFSIRPPSVADGHSETTASRSDPLVMSPGSQAFPLKPTLSNDSGLIRRPDPVRTQSSSVVLKRERLPITNAIDTWALGVTLYCLLFGRTPFDAPNEYLLMQVIPTSEYHVPPLMGRDRMRTGRDGGLGESEEAKECLDLLRRLLEKDPVKRISTEQAKKHSFTLRGLTDPTSWLASTDPHAQTSVTVSNDEVAAVVVKSSSFRDKFRKSIKSISHKLQIFGAGGRSRSRSIGDVDSTGASAHTSTVPSTVASQVSLNGLPSDKSVKSTSGPQGTSTGKEPITTSSQPPGSLSRRFSILGSRPQNDVPSPRRQTIQLASPPLPSGPVETSQYDGGSATHIISGPVHQTVNRGFVVHRNASVPSAVSPAVSVSQRPFDASKPPRAITSSSSLDKLKGTAETSARSNLRRRQSSDAEVRGRRPPSPASSPGRKGLGSKLGRLLSRTSSQRSRFRKKDKGATGSTDIDDGPPTVLELGPPSEAVSRLSVEDGTLPHAKRIYELDPQIPATAVLAPSEDSDDRLGGLTWESRRRDRPVVRRGSSISEDFTRGVDEEEVDWTEPLSDDDEYGHPTTRAALPQSAPNFGQGWRQAGTDILGLEVVPRTPQSTSPAPVLGPIPDGLPAGSTDHPVVPVFIAANSSKSSPTSTTFPSEFGLRSSSRASERASNSLFRSELPPDRTRSPLGLMDDPKTSPLRLGLARQTSSSVLENDEGDEGLAISTGSRRGRKGSMFGRPSFSAER